MVMIQLRAGPLVREDAILLALALEAEGRTMRATADGKLEVKPAIGLTQLQRHSIHKMRHHLLALAAYQPPEAR